MKNPFKKSNTELDLSNVGKILSTGAATGVSFLQPLQLLNTVMPPMLATTNTANTYFLTMRRKYIF